MTVGGAIERYVFEAFIEHVIALWTDRNHE